MAVYGILRQYNDAYLAEIGQPGTRNLPVFGLRPGGAGLLRAEFDVGMSAQASLASVDFGYIRDGDYAHEEVPVALDSTSHGSVTVGPLRYSMRLGGAQPRLLVNWAGGVDNHPYLYWTGEGTSWEQGGHTRRHTVSAIVFVEELWCPWWGVLADAPGYNYDAPEGHWALLVEVEAASRSSGGTGEAWAHWAFWAYSGDRCHRLRGVRRDFYASSDGVLRTGPSSGNWSAVGDELGAWVQSFARDVRFSVQLAAGSGRPA